MQRSPFLILLLLVCSSLGAQDFEGIIEFKMQKGVVSESSVWYVKDNLVRVDQFEPGTRMLKEAYIINTKDSSVNHLDHKAKTFGKAFALLASVPTNCKVETTKNTKEIQTYKAKETLVGCEDSTFSYWMSNDDFAFFRTTAYALGAMNEYLNFYWALDKKENGLPLLVIKHNAKGEETGRFEAVRIEKRSLDIGLFATPADYKPRK